ncbi:GtrA family protein [Aquibacillus kalidii]|uniref:GtrA family protein n=1 Tax=Aquibacillus kalidii TaxID=2762597 RepID=UPI001647DB39|nr:GtrA family protein [Aquibacillus kalidii]
MTKKFKIQLLQFGFIGLSNAVVDIVSLNILLFIWPTDHRTTLILFNTIAYILTIINSYIWNTKYTFSHHANMDSKEILFFILQAAVALIISNLVFIGAVDVMKSQSILQLPTLLIQNIAKGLAMLLSSSASFLFMKFFVFKSNQTKQANR